MQRTRQTGLGGFCTASSFATSRANGFPWHTSSRKAGTATLLQRRSPRSKNGCRLTQPKATLRSKDRGTLDICSPTTQPRNKKLSRGSFAGFMTVRWRLRIFSAEYTQNGLCDAGSQGTGAKIVANTYSPPSSSERLPPAVKNPSRLRLTLRLTMKRRSIFWSTGGQPGRSGRTTQGSTRHYYCR